MPIGSGGKGYWWVKDAAGMVSTISHLEDRKTALEQDIIACNNPDFDTNIYDYFREPKKTVIGSRGEQISMGDDFGMSKNVFHGRDDWD
jgi:hypothetical protein